MLHFPEAAGFGIHAWREPDQALEVALQVVSAAPKPRGQNGQRHVTIRACQVIAGLPHFRKPRIDGRDLRSTPFARPEARALGVPRELGKHHAIATRAATRTRRPAEDAGGDNRVDKRPVCAAIATEHGAPSGGVRVETGVAIQPNFVLQEELPLFRHERYMMGKATRIGTRKLLARR